MTCGRAIRERRDQGWVETHGDDLGQRTGRKIGELELFELGDGGAEVVVERGEEGGDVVEGDAR
jgi:hypothetical protein